MRISEELLTWLISLIGGLLILLVVGNVVFLSLFSKRVYPRIKIDQIDVGGLTYDQAEQLLQKSAPKPPVYQLTLKVDQATIASSSSQLGLRRNYQEALNQAYNFGRLGSPLERIKTLLKIVFAEQTFSTQLTYDPTQLNQLISTFKNRLDYPAQKPSAKLAYSGSPRSLTIDPGKSGRELIATATFNSIREQIGHAATISAQVASISAQLNPEEIEQAKKKASALINKRLLFRAENVRLELNDQKLISLLAFPEGYQETELGDLINSWADVINRPAQNAVFDYDPESLVVEEFQPDRPGLQLNRAETIQKIKETIEKNISDQPKAQTETASQGTAVGLGEQRDFEFELPVQTTEADITLEETNDLGIRERIGLGESEYDHSIPNRIHNVKITADRVSGAIIPPGEEFSFNQTLGEVSPRTGYRSAYVIRNGRTELGDGGGVCQVSTTVFRAVLDAGLKITMRLPHSYRVSYYELNSKPGVDATVYAGNVDLRFINDTDQHLLLYSEADSQNLYMKVELYGTSDGRTTEITDHQVWDYTPPPPPEYYPDPSLPVGTIKQVDWAVAGAKAKFTHIIKNAEGEVVSKKTYYSSYQPWSAKYLVGE